MMLCYYARNHTCRVHARTAQWRWCLAAMRRSVQAVVTAGDRRVGSAVQQRMPHAERTT